MTSVRQQLFSVIKQRLLTSARHRSMKLHHEGPTFGLFTHQPPKLILPHTRISTATSVDFILGYIIRKPQNYLLYTKEFKQITILSSVN